MGDISSKILTDITKLISKPCDKHIDTAIVVPNSSIATSSVFFQQLDLHIRRKNKHFKTVLINSKESTTMRQILKTIVDSVTKEPSSTVIRKINDDDLNEDLFDIADDGSDDEINQNFDKRLPFDLDIVEEWCLNQNKNSKKNDVRIILMFEDIDSFNISLLNRLLKLCYSFVNKIPLKFIFNVGTNLKSFAKKLNNEMTHFLKFNHFKIEQTDTIINKIVNDVIISEDYLLGEDLTRFILNRFTNSIKTVDEFSKILKFAKMTFFYANPLSIIASKLFNKETDLNLTEPYFQSLRMLPSFKKYVNSIIEEPNFNSQKVKNLLDNDFVLVDLLKESFRIFSENSRHFKSIYKLSTEILSKKAFNKEKNFLEIYYKLSSKDEFVRIQFLNELISKLKENINDLDELKEILQEISEQAENDDICQSLISKLNLNLNFNELDKLSNQKNLPFEKLSLQLKIEFRKLKDSFFKTLDEFLKRNIKGDYRIAVFNEIYQFNDIDVIQINLVPNFKSNLQDQLINHENYLGESKTNVEVLDKLNNSMDPFLSNMYKIYRETTLHLNIFDFYTSFKYSLNKDEVMKDLNTILDDENQIFENYLNDKRRFHFIYQFFNEVDITNDEKWDKITLALFLQKCEEMISCGLFKFLTKKKLDTLEKSSWKDL